METFEYRCNYCDFLFEYKGNAQDDLPACPICRGETIRIQDIFKRGTFPDNEVVQETFLTPEVMEKNP